MARLYPILVAVPLLAACATSSPIRPTGDPSYLEGLSTEFSVRVEELQIERFEELANEFPQALVAGNQDLTLCATMFRQGPYLALDLIVHNHGAKDMELSREDVYVIDHMGSRLEPVAEWEGAELYGLRGRIREEQEIVYLGRAEIPPTKVGQPRAREGSGKVGPTSTKRDIPDIEIAPDYDILLQPVEVHKTLVDSPEAIDLKPGDKRVFWTYYSTGGDSLHFPLNAVVRVGGRRLIFRFNAPPGPAA